ncbi:MAG: hypothetical protein EA402_12705 [Planctomycetota bacterium]|nr:MAG: hypothetical protein EA402_12705 [Planctomycetota bacterium]
MNRSLAMHFAVWVALLALIIAGRWIFHAADLRIAPVSTASAPTPELLRPASLEEWSSDIVSLGRRGQGKLLVWQDLSGRSWPPGALVWWHDGQQERLGWRSFTHPGESSAAVSEAEATVAALVRGIAQGRVVLYALPADDHLRQRLAQGFPGSARLPAGLEILRPPLSGDLGAPPLDP